MRPVLLLLLLAATTQAQSPPTSSSSKHTTPKPPIEGELNNNLYRNAYFGFTCKVPFGWVDRTQQMNEGTDDGSLVLLATFERPPDAAGDTVNSAIVIAAGKLSKTSKDTPADAFDAVTEAATTQGFKADAEPYGFTVGVQKTVRGDFTRTTNQLTMHQSSLEILDKGYAITFTFIAGTEEDVEQLIDNLTFGK
jgi:hypothetical protein